MIDIRTVEGHSDAKFSRLRKAFEENFAERKEIGAAVCVHLYGRPVVDLWGGFLDAHRSRPWERDSLVCMMSVSKAMTALCAHILIDRGLLDLDKPVAHYWPAFAQAGKAEISVDVLISHLAALVYPDEAPVGSLPDWEVFTAALAAQAPAWAPGTRGAYHSSTFGHLIGELVRRVSGMSLPDVLAAEVTGPLGADFTFGVPPGGERRLADFIVDPRTVSTRLIASDGDAPLNRAWRPLPRQPDVFNSPMWRTSLLPSANGVGNARSASRIMAAAIGPIDGRRLLSPAAVDRIREERWYEECGLTGRLYRYGRGFSLHNPAYHPMTGNPRAFGHAGVGGSYVFADPEAGLSFSYCTNHTAIGDNIGDRARALVAAMVECL